jgi:transcriptional regulator with XRE-family HTH domain
MTPSERLFIARKTLGLSTSEMAAALGLKGENAKDDFRKMEKGGREPSGPVLVAAEALVRIRELEQQLGIELANKSANEE